MSTPGDAPLGVADGLTTQRWQAVTASAEADDQRLAALLDKPLRDHYDVVVIGSGPGGATVAWALRATGHHVLLVERGDFLPREPENWDSREVLGRQRYSNSAPWLDDQGRPFQPHMYHYVGGMAKLYAGTLLRMRAQDFGETTHADGVSPSWPISYDDLEPFYAQAERLYLAHGESGIDPTEPARSGPFPFPPVPHAPEIDEVADRLRSVGLTPFPLPQGLALHDGGRCIQCAYCDSHPCRILAKGEPELCCVRPALASPTVTLLHRTTAERILTSPDGRSATGVELRRQDANFRVAADIVVVACGAVHTPALLLKSADANHPNGLANGNGLVGANYMRHLSTVVLARHPRSTPLPQNHYWKTLGVHDFYLRGPDGPRLPLGAVQVTGNYHEEMAALLPDAGEDSPPDLAAHMVSFFLLTEDLPGEANRITLTRNGQIQVRYTPTNVQSHERLIALLQDLLHRAGFGTTTARSFLTPTAGGGYHHCGTVRMGNDESDSVLDPTCRTHEVRNLYVTDASCFPSSSAVNPVLTICANALRISAHLRQQLQGTSSRGSPGPPPVE